MKGPEGWDGFRGTQHSSLLDECPGRGTLGLYTHLDHLGDSREFNDGFHETWV